MPYVTKWECAGQSQPETVECSIPTGFSEDNLIHEVFFIESEMVSPDTTEKAYGILEKILQKTREYLLKNPELEPREKLKCVYDVMREVGIELTPQYQKALLTDNLANKGLDCDTSSLVVMAIAHEFKWPVHMVMLPNHIFVRWEGEKESFNIDYGKIFPDLFYKWNDGLREADFKVAADYRSLVLGNRAGKKLLFGEIKDAIEDTDEAIRLDPRNLNALTRRAGCKGTLALQYKMMERPNEANRYYNESMADFREVLDAHPSYNSAFEGIAFYMDKFGHREDADELINGRLKSAFSFKQMSENLKRSLAPLFTPFN